MYIAAHYHSYMYTGSSHALATTLRVWKVEYLSLGIN
jgi:hypothetical protein